MADNTYPWPAVVREPLAETRQVEYKEGIVWEDIEPKVFRAVLAMSNTEDGGYVVVGVPEENGTWKAKGIDNTAWATYPKLQTFDQQLSSAGHPLMNVSVEEKEDQGKRFLLITVRSSISGPVMCTRSCKPEGKKGVRAGTIYYRTMAKQSRPAEAIDWEEIIGRFRQNELLKGFAQGISNSAPKISSKDLFSKELDGF